MKTTATNHVVAVTVREIADNGKVRIGATSPSFPPLHVTPSSVADGGKVRIGATSPSLPPARCS